MTATFVLNYFERFLVNLSCYSCNGCCCREVAEEILNMNEMIITLILYIFLSNWVNFFNIEPRLPMNN